MEIEKIITLRKNMSFQMRQHLNNCEIHRLTNSHILRTGAVRTGQDRSRQGILEFRDLGVQEFRCLGNQGHEDLGIQGLRDVGIFGFMDSGIQGLGDIGIQGEIQEFGDLRIKGF